MQTYELTYIVSPDITSEEAEKKAKEIESAIQKSEGVIIRQVNPVAKTLSFPIKGRSSGFFGIIEFQLEQEKLQEVQTAVKKDGKIVRHMLLAKNPVKIKKQRRSKKAENPALAASAVKEEKTEIAPQEPAKEKEGKSKVELKDIEQRLDEILGE